MEAAIRCDGINGFIGVLEYFSGCDVVLGPYNYKSLTRNHLSREHERGMSGREPGVCSVVLNQNPSNVAGQLNLLLFMSHLRMTSTKEHQKKPVSKRSYKMVLTKCFVKKILQHKGEF